MRAAALFFSKVSTNHVLTFWRRNEAIHVLVPEMREEVTKKISSVVKVFTGTATELYKIEGVEKMNKKKIVAGALAVLTVASTTPSAFAEGLEVSEENVHSLAVDSQKDISVPYAVMSTKGLEDAGLTLLSQEEGTTTAPQAEQTLQEQINAAPDDVETRITLQGDVSGDLTIPTNKNIVLELAEGSKLTNVSGHTITNNGTLTIEGTGTVDNISHGKAAVHNNEGGIVILNGGTYTRSKENGQSASASGGNSYYNIVNWGTMTINDGVKVNQSGHFSSMIENGFYDGTGKTNNPKLTINGGTFSGGLNTVKNDDRGILEVKGGTFSNVSQAALLNWNEAVIEGGEFKANDGAQAVVLNGHINDGMDQGKLTINGGSFTASGSAAVIKQMTGNGSQKIGTIEINDGTFKTGSGEIISLVSGTEAAAKINIAKGSFTTTNESAKTALSQYVDPSAEFDASTGTVSAIPVEQAVVSVGAKNYKTLAAAINAAQTGDTVVLKQDVTESVTVPAGKEITLDLAGKNIQSNDATSKNAVTAEGKLTVKDSTAATAPEVSGDAVTYVSGKITASNLGLYAIKGGEIVLESGSVESTRNIGVFVEGNKATTGNAVTSKITVKGGYILSQENAASAQGRGAELNIEGGVLKAKDNAVVSGNGTKNADKDFGGTTINISDGTMIGGIQTPNFIACGVYHPQQGTLNITGGKFQITNGVGLLIRAGSANITGGEIVTTGSVNGKVGDSQIIEGCYGVVYDSVSKYPGAADADKIAVGGDTKIVTDNGNAPIKMRRPESSTDNKIGVTGGTFSAPVEKEYLEGLNAELNTGKGDTPYSYYTDVNAAKEAAKQLGGGTVTDLTSPNATKFTVTLKFDDGATANQVLTVAENGTVILPTPTRSGSYAFRYWTDGTNTYAAGSEYTVTKEATLTAVWRYTGSSSSSSSSTRYTVSVPSVANGSVSVTPTSATKGATVTITVKPNEGYELGKLTVTDQSGNRLSLTDKGNGKHTFTMPAGKVSVDATFAKIEMTINFRDVKQSDYYYDAVKWAVEKGITEGTSATTFSPNVSCTRAQMVTFLWRAAGSPVPKSTNNPFKDISSTDYFYNAVLWAVENDITTGTGADTFSPSAKVNRAQTVTFLYRAAGSPASGSSSFSDVPESAYFAKAVAWADANDITNGTSNVKFSPNADCTRGQIVTLLYRANS